MRNSNVNERGNARRRIRLILNCYRTHVLTILSALLSHNIVMLLRRRSLNLPPLKYHKVKPLKTRHKAEFYSYRWKLSADSNASSMSNRHTEIIYRSDSSFPREHSEQQKIRSVGTDCEV